MEDPRLIPDVHKILVLRAMVLGDLVFALPALDALHQAYPQAEIVHLGRPWVKDFLPGRIPGIGRVLTFHSSNDDYEDLGYLIDPREAKGLLPQLQAEHFDLAVQMQGGGVNANALIKRIGARVSIGPKEPKAAPLDRWFLYQYHQHEILRLLETVALAGAATADPHPHLPVLDSDRSAAAPYLDRIPCPFVVIHAGARDIRRCWPPGQFAQVADQCKRELGLNVVLTGTNLDLEQVTAVQKQMGEEAINLCGQLSLPALIGVLEHAQLYIGNDTGVMHVALAVGGKAVGLFWVEYLIKSLPLSRTIFYPLIDWNRYCPECRKFMDFHEVIRSDPAPCRHAVSFINHIQPQEVLQAARLLLEQA